MTDVNKLRDMCQEIIDKNHEIKTLFNCQINISSNLYGSILKLLDEEYRRGFNDGVASSEKSNDLKETVKENTDKINNTKNEKNKESKNEISDEMKLLMSLLGLLE